MAKESGCPHCGYPLRTNDLKEPCELCGSKEHSFIRIISLGYTYPAESVYVHRLILFVAVVFAAAIALATLTVILQWI